MQCGRPSEGTVETRPGTGLGGPAKRGSGAGGDGILSSQMVSWVLRE